jgi:hypothetical protein
LYFEKDRAPLPARPYSPEWRVSAQAQILADSGETSFSKWERRFHFEEEKQRNERALFHRDKANDMELATTSGRNSARLF